MQNDMRDRLVELIKECFNKESDIMFCENRPLEFDEWTGIYADHLIANGAILPPCNVGDTVYKIVNDKRVKKPYKCKVIGLWYSADETFNDIYLVHYVNGVFESSFSVPFTEVGKTVFLTKDQAEQKLKEMRVENGNL